MHWEEQVEMVDSAQTGPSLDSFVGWAMDTILGLDHTGHVIMKEDVAKEVLIAVDKELNRIAAPFSQADLMSLFAAALQSVARRRAGRVN